MFNSLFHLSIWNDMVRWLENHMGSCFYKRNFGIECPGCGMQRAIIELLKGNIVDSFLLFPALFPLLFTLFYLILHIIFKYKYGALVLKISFIFTTSIMIIAYIIKIIN